MRRPLPFLKDHCCVLFLLKRNGVRAALTRLAAWFGDLYGASFLFLNFASANSQRNQWHDHRSKRLSHSRGPE